MGTRAVDVFELVLSIWHPCVELDKPPYYPKAVSIGWGFQVFLPPRETRGQTKRGAETPLLVFLVGLTVTTDAGCPNGDPGDKRSVGSLHGIPE